MTPPDVPAAGAAGALTEAYLEMRPTLVRIFAARLRSTEAAEDLVQELYVRVSRAADPQEIADPKAWLFRAASNLLIDRRRDRSRGELRDGAWLQAHMPEEAPQSPSAASPERVVAGRQVLEKALAAVDALPPRMAQAFRLARIQGLSHAQVASQMGVSTKAVEKHVAAALERLTAELRGIWP